MIVGAPGSRSSPQRSAWLAKRVGVHLNQIGKYEHAASRPSADALKRLADVFEVSLDYLAFDDRDESRRVNIADVELLERLAAVDKLSAEDRDTIKAVIDSFLLKNEFQRLAGAG